MHTCVNMCKLANTRCVYSRNIRVGTHTHICTDVGTYTNTVYLHADTQHTCTLHTHTHANTLTTYVDTHNHAYMCTHPALRTHCRCTRWSLHQRSSSSGGKTMRLNEAERGIKTSDPHRPTPAT